MAGRSSTNRSDLTSARVDILQMLDGSALALWMEYVSGSEAIVLCHIFRAAGCTAPQALYVNRGARSVGFPRMTRGESGAFVAWTQPTSSPDGDPTIRMVEFAVIPKISSIRLDFPVLP